MMTCLHGANKSRSIAAFGMGWICYCVQFVLVGAGTAKEIQTLFFKWRELYQSFFFC